MGRWSYSNRQEAGGLKQIRVSFLKKYGYLNRGLMGTMTWSRNGEETGNSFKEQWGNSQTHWSFGGFIGAGIEFKWVNLSSVILHIGADILPLSQKADGKYDYSGMLIHIAFNRFRK